MKQKIFFWSTEKDRVLSEYLQKEIIDNGFKIIQVMPFGFHEMSGRVVAAIIICEPLA